MTVECTERYLFKRPREKTREVTPGSDELIHNSIFGDKYYEELCVVTPDIVAIQRTAVPCGQPVIIKVYEKEQINGAGIAWNLLTNPTGLMDGKLWGEYRWVKSKNTDEAPDDGSNDFNILNDAGNIASNAWNRTVTPQKEPVLNARDVRSVLERETALQRVRG